MALGPNTIFTSCPRCNGAIGEAFRGEAGEMGNAEDFAVYICLDGGCNHMFDYITEPKEN